ncbi:hypothetical protein [Paulownia witches'-broom phytoplasma]|nr:hypothetical protein [Paulownia witches'-broom phytoplasma]GLH60880.1 hypothetical protein PAWBP_6180 [Paulownia witches'-broom phytoplasma]
MKQIKSSYIIYTFVIIIFIAIITLLFIREYNKRNQKTGYHDAN